MSAPRLRWFKKLLYRISFHTDVEKALKARFQDGVEIGKKQIQPAVTSQGTCPKHPLLLLNNKGHGEYCCMMCKEEEQRNTGPIQQYPRLMDRYNSARKHGMGPNTAILHITDKQTRDLRKWQEQQLLIGKQKGDLQ